MRVGKKKKGKKKQQHEAEIGNQWRAVLQAPGAVTQDGATHRNTAASRRHEGKLMWPAERQWEQEEGVFEWVARRGVVRYIKELVKCSRLLGVGGRKSLSVFPMTNRLIAPNRFNPSLDDFLSFLSFFPQTAPR